MDSGIFLCCHTNLKAECDFKRNYDVNVPNEV